MSGNPWDVESLRVALRGKDEPMSWQADCHKYMELRDRLAQLESRQSSDCSCDSSNFHRCELCDEIDEVSRESRRLLDLWGDLWTCKLWRICQEGEPVTQIYFGEEVPQ